MPQHEQLNIITPHLIYYYYAVATAISTIHNSNMLIHFTYVLKKPPEGGHLLIAFFVALPTHLKFLIRQDIRLIFPCVNTE